MHSYIRCLRGHFGIVAGTLQYVSTYIYTSSIHTRSEGWTHNLTEHWKPQNTGIVELYVDHKRRSTAIKAPKLWKIQSGATNNLKPVFFLKSHFGNHHCDVGTSTFCVMRACKEGDHDVLCPSPFRSWSGSQQAESLIAKDVSKIIRIIRTKVCLSLRCPTDAYELDNFAILSFSIINICSL